MVGAGAVWGDKTDTGQASSPKWAKTILSLYRPTFSQCSIRVEPVDSKCILSRSSISRR